MKLDDDKEAREILKNGLGAYGNRMRAVFNKGYSKGFEDGKREAIEMLMQNIDTMRAEQTEPSDPCKGCIYDNDENMLACVACVLKEKQTDCSWK